MLAHGQTPTSSPGTDALEGESARADAAPVLCLEGVTKYWGWKRRGTPVLSGVDLELFGGTATWIGGRNGAGKTTLLRLAGGLLAADEGEISLHGLSPERQRRRYQRMIGFLSAGDRGLYPRLSVTRHLRLWAKVAFVPPSDRGAAVDRAVARFGLEPLLAKRVDRLSLGQRQRLKLSLAFLHDPELVLLDEPGNSLDEDGIALLSTALSVHTARGGVAIWCSPVGEAGPLPFDRRFVIDSGRLLIDGA